MVDVGVRVRLITYRGTVGYVGPVGNGDGDWVGVDWDDEILGKSDGSFNGKIYFRARGNRSASFLPISCVKTGGRITEEMEERYGAHIDLYEPTLKTAGVAEMLEAKEKDLWKLRFVMLDSMNVALPPTPDCPPFTLCTELSLFNNLISTWNDLLNILTFFPSLRYLNVRRNVMEAEMKSVDADRVVAAPIFHLVAAECRIDEITATRVLKVFPHLRELYLTWNNLQRFCPPKYDSSLSFIDLEGNPVKDFQNVHNLSLLPRLSSLNLTDCGLEMVELPETVGFVSLETLLLRGNKIDDWKSIAELARLPSLKRLFWRNCGEVRFGLEVREILIAKLPSLVELDGYEICDIERRSAEIRFLAKCGIPPVKAEHVADVERLKAIHGEPVAQQTETTVRLLKIKLRYGENQCGRSVPAATIVYQLRGMVSRLFHINHQMISFCVHYEGGREVWLDNPLRSLEFYGVKDGDTVVGYTT